MKIHIELGNTVVEYEHQTMPLERFGALCKLAGGAIGGGVLVALVRMVGFCAIPWAAGMVALYWLGKGIAWMCHP